MRSGPRPRPRSDESRNRHYDAQASDDPTTTRSRPSRACRLKLTSQIGAPAGGGLLSVPSPRSGCSRNNSTHSGRHRATRRSPTLMRANQLPSGIFRSHAIQYNGSSLALVASKFFMASSTEPKLPAPTWSFRPSLGGVAPYFAAVGRRTIARCQRPKKGQLLPSDAWRPAGVGVVLVMQSSSRKHLVNQNESEGCLWLY